MNLMEKNHSWSRSHTPRGPKVWAVFVARVLVPPGTCMCVNWVWGVELRRWQFLVVGIIRNPYSYDWAISKKEKCWSALAWHDTDMCFCLDITSFFFNQVSKFIAVIIRTFHCILSLAVWVKSTHLHFALCFSSSLSATEGLLRFS